MSARQGEDELRDFDPTAEHGGGPCKGCGIEQEPWRFADYCQACIWDGRHEHHGERETESTQGTGCT